MGILPMSLTGVPPVRVFAVFAFVSVFAVVVRRKKKKKDDERRRNNKPRARCP
jgi:hypothetical protein